MSNSRASTNKKQKTGRKTDKIDTKKGQKRNRSMERRFIRIDENGEGGIADVDYDEMVNEDGTVNVFCCPFHNGHRYYLYHRGENYLEPIFQNNSFIRNNTTSYVDKKTMDVKNGRLVRKDLKPDDESLTLLEKDKIYCPDIRLKRKEKQISGMTESSEDHLRRFVRLSLRLEEKHEEIKMHELLEDQDTGETNVFFYKEKAGCLYFLKHNDDKYEPIFRYISVRSNLEEKCLDMYNDNNISRLENGHLRIGSMPDKRLNRLERKQIPPSQGWHFFKEFKDHQAVQLKKTPAITNKSRSRKKDRTMERRFVRVDENCDSGTDDVRYDEMVNEKDGTTNVLYCYVHNGYRYYLYHRHVDCLEPIFRHNTLTVHYADCYNPKTMGMENGRLVMKNLKPDDKSLKPLGENEIVNADGRIRGTGRYKKPKRDMEDPYEAHKRRFVRLSFHLNEQYGEIGMDELLDEAGNTKVFTQLNHHGLAYFLMHGDRDVEPIYRCQSVLQSSHIDRNKPDTRELENGYLRMTSMLNKPLEQLNPDEIPPSQGWRSFKEFKKHQAEQLKETTKDDAVDFISNPELIPVTQNIKKTNAATRPLGSLGATSFGLFPQSRKRKKEGETDSSPSSLPPPSSSYFVDEKESMEEENMNCVEENDTPDAPEHPLFHGDQSNAQVLQKVGTFLRPFSVPMGNNKQEKYNTTATITNRKFQNNK